MRGKFAAPASTVITSRASAQRSKKHSGGVSLPSVQPLYITPRSPAVESAVQTAQLFPYSVTHKDTGAAYVLTLEGATLRLKQHGLEVAYFTLDIRSDNWGMKNIFVHGEGLQGQNIGVLLVYIAANLARSNGIRHLPVLTPSGEGLWAKCGFVKHGEKDIAGDSETVYQTAGAIVNSAFKIGPYVPPVPASKPPPNKDPRRNEDDLNKPGGPFEL
ncbi:MAG: hypothetical protein MUC87_17135 [Bacteroidia bacterium]|jgi:hypothetical protein|nr:hypothetical protein [Bacteroidia bacterium]